MRWPAALLGAISLFAVACGDDGGGASPPVATTSTAGTPRTTSTTSTTTSTMSTQAPAGRPYEIDSRQLTFVDETRPTPETANSEPLPTRTIDVWIDLPVTDEPRPLLIFSHGLTGHPTSHGLHRSDLARQGFVVVAPAFPLTNGRVDGAGLNVGDIDGQIGDVSFLVDAVMADPDVGPRIDPDRIGAIGHSLGGLTTAGAALSPGGDDRFGAAIVMSAGFGPPRYDLAVLVLHGDADLTVPIASSETSYALLAGRRMFVVLQGGDHVDGIIDDESEHGEAVRGLTAAFFAHELGVDAGHVAAIDGLPLDSVTIEAGTAAGPLKDWRDYFSS